MSSPRAISIRKGWVTTVVGLVAAGIVGGVVATATMAPAAASPRIAAKKPPPTSTTTGPATSTTSTTSPSTTSTSPTSTSTTSTTSTTTPTAPTGCSSGSASANGTTYCVGYVFAVLRTAYGVGARVVTQAVWVSAVQGSTVTVSGGPACFPDEWCGQTVPSMTVTLPAGSPSLAVGDVVDVYGSTVTAGLAPDGVTVLGTCAEFGC
jgi:hypothetical protein